MLVVYAVDSTDVGQLVKSEVEEEEHGVVNDYAGSQLKHQLPACWGERRQGTVCLQRRIQREAVQCWCEKVSSHGDCAWVIVAAYSHVADRHASKFLDHRKIHEEERCNICQAFSYAILGPLKLRDWFIALVPILYIRQAQLWLVDESINIRALNNGVYYDCPESLEGRGPVDWGGKEAGVGVVKGGLIESWHDDCASKEKPQDES